MPINLLPSLISTNHVWIGGGRGKSWRALVDALHDYYPVKAAYKPKYTPGRSRLVRYTRRGQVHSEVYEPTYLELQLPSAGIAAVKLSYTPERTVAIPTGAVPARLRAWAYLDLPGSGLYRYPLQFVAGDKGALAATVRLPVPQLAGARLLVGTRVDAQDDPADNPPENLRVRLNWELTYDPREVALAGAGWRASPGSEPASSGTSETARREVAIMPGQGQVIVLPPVDAAGDVPLIRATHRDKQTVSLAPVVHSHQRWEWDFGDGTVTADNTPGSMAGVAEHTYLAPGKYTCAAVSRTADGIDLARWRWEAEVDTARVGVPIVFSATTVGAPEISLHLDGPAAWVTGRPAQYKLTYDLPAGAGEGVRAELAYFYPGPVFEMIWERPGRFTVTGALALRLTYRDGDGIRSVLNVYTVERQVDVYATVVTD